MNDTIIPKSKIEIVTSLANSQNKCCIIVDDFYKSKGIFCENKNQNQDFINRPLILIVSYGSRTQISCWETIIYKLLCNNKIKAFSTPSSELNSVLEWFSLCKLTKYGTTINTESKLDFEVEVRGIHLSSIDKYDQILSQLKPDLTVISTCNNHNDYDNIRNIFKFRYGYIIDFFAKSESMKMIDKNGNEKNIFDFAPFNLNNKNEFEVSLKDPVLVRRLSKLILPKIKLPDGVMII